MRDKILNCLEPLQCWQNLTTSRLGNERRGDSSFWRGNQRENLFGAGVSSFMCDDVIQAQDVIWVYLLKFISPKRKKKKKKKNSAVKVDFNRHLAAI